MTASSSTKSASVRRRWLLGSLGLLILLAGGGVYWYFSPPRPNIILVTLDTTRADRLGIYGYKQGLTKAFDDFAARGVVFTRAYAPAPVTLPSHATMLTGLYPPEHGLRVNGYGQLPHELPTLPEILKNHGYDTAAFIAAAPVLGAKFGLNRGFDTYDDNPAKLPARPGHFGEPRRDGKEIVDLVLSWLRQRKSRPFFCWLHLYDAHAPYDPRPETYQLRFMQHPYDAGIAWQVQQFERLNAELKKRKLDSNTIVVVVGDHGEGLEDHLETEHGMLVYNTTLHVPFVFVGTRHCRPDTQVSQVVSLVDLMPTLLDILRIPSEKHISGRSLRTALQGQPIESRDCYAEADTPYLMNRWSPLRTIVSDRWKYIQTTRPELYDLERDPGEVTNLADSTTDESQHMRNLLEELQEKFVVSTAQNLTLSENDLASLRALGYVSGGKPTNPASDSTQAKPLPDIKDFLPQLAEFERAKHLFLEGKIKESIPVLQQILQQTSDFDSAELLLADGLLQAGRLEEAEASYRSVVARRPDYFRVHFTLGKILAGQNQLERAASEFREFIKESPTTAAAHFELAQVLTNQKKVDEAIFEYGEALRLSPEMAIANISLGRLFMTLRRSAEAIACFEQALKHDSKSYAAHENLSFLMAQMGQFGNAIRHAEQAIQLEPKSFDMRLNLGLLLVAQKRFADGISQFRQAQKLRPDDPRPGQQIQNAEAALRRSKP